MIVNNKTEQAFGRTTAFAGLIFLLSGIVMIVAGAIVLGAVAAILSAFVLFTYSGVELDTARRRIKQYNKIFGIIKTGKWQSLEPYIGLTLIPISTIETMASWSNRISSTKSTDYRIYLVNKAKKPAFVIKKCFSKENAINSLDEFSLWLKLPVYSVKR